MGDEIESIVIDVALQFRNLGEATVADATALLGHFERSVQRTQQTLARMNQSTGQSFNSFGASIASGFAAGEAAMLRFTGQFNRVHGVIQGFDRFVAGLSGTITNAVGSVGGLTTALTGGGRGVLGGLGGAIQSVVGLIGGGIGFVGGGLVGALLGLPGMVVGVVQGITGAISGIASSIGNVISGVFDALGSVAKTLTRFPALILEGAVGYGGLVWPLQLAGNLEMATMSFENFYGSADKANKVIGEIRQLAITTPFRFPELMDLGKVLAVANVPAERLTFYLRQIGTAALGIRPEQREQEFRTIGRAVQQTLQQGFISGYEAREFRHAGIPVEELLMREYAPELGARGIDIRQALQDRILPARRSIRAIFEGIANDPRFQLLPEKWAKTFPGQLSVLQDLVETQFVTQWGMGLARGFEPGLQGIIDWFTKNPDAIAKINTGLERVALSLSGFLVDRVTGFFTMLGDFFSSASFMNAPSLIDALLDGLGDFGKWLRWAWTEGVPSAIGAFQSFWHWLADPNGAWDTGKRILGNVNEPDSVIGAIDAAARSMGLWGGNTRDTAIQANTLSATFVGIVTSVRDFATTVENIIKFIAYLENSLNNINNTLIRIATNLPGAGVATQIPSFITGAGDSPGGTGSVTPGGMPIVPYYPGQGPYDFGPQYPTNDQNERITGSIGTSGRVSAGGIPLGGRLNELPSERGASLSIAQFGDYLRAKGFSEDAIAAACGPIAAAGIARALNPSKSDPASWLSHATRYGWSFGGMGGGENFVRMLQGEAGIQANFGTYAQAIAAIQSGTPVAIDAPGAQGHYFLAQGMRGGQFDVGESGQVFAGGRGGRFLSIAQMAALTGNNPDALRFIIPQGGTGRTPIESYIRMRAASLGINPDVAVRVAMSEGGVTEGARPGDRGTSFGPYQLHYGGGLGDAFTQQTGLNARDPGNVYAGIDFALQNVAKGGWSPFHGAARVGIGNWEGIGSEKGGGSRTPLKIVINVGAGDLRGDLDALARNLAGKIAAELDHVKHNVMAPNGV